MSSKILSENGGLYFSFLCGEVAVSAECGITRVCHLRNAQPQARQGLGVFYGIIFCTYKSECGGRSFEGTEVSTREELVGDGDTEGSENQGEVIRAGVEDAEIVTWQPVYLPTV